MISRMFDFMFNYRRLGTILSLLVLNADNLSLAQSQEGTATVRTESVAKFSPESLAKLTDSLVNRNVVPTLVGRKDSHEPVFEKDYDWREQTRIQESIQILIDHVEDAWPALVQHLGDKRYCLTVSMDGDAGNLSVGSVCEAIITANLCMLYGGCLPDAAEDLRWSLRFPDILYETSVKSWCEKRKNKQLWQLQIEVAEWVVQQVKNCREEGLEDSDRRTSVNALTTKLRKTRESRKPVLLKDFRWSLPCDMRFYNEKWAAIIRNRHLAEQPSAPKATGAQRPTP